MFPVVFHKASIVLAFCLTQVGLEFGEDHFNRIEGGAAGRQD